MKKSSFAYFLLLAFILLIPLGVFFRPGLPLTHDGEIQVARIASFYQSLSEGNIVPRWAGNLNWGYGTPILMFVYPLPSYVASLFHFLGFSFIDSAKAVFILGFIFSGLFMYLWIKEIWGEKAALVAGIFYAFAPYRFVDLYVRGAIGENFAFIWPPLICWFILRLFTLSEASTVSSAEPRSESKGWRWRYLAGGSFAIAALVLSHNMLSLMFLPVIFGYMGYLVFISKRKLLITSYYLLITIFGFALSAFFWLPALWEGKYTLRDIVTKGNVVGFERLFRLIWSPWNYGGTGVFSVQLGILLWPVVILTPLLIWLFWRKRDKTWVWLAFVFLCFWLTIFLILPAAKPLYLIIPLLTKFQFAWRFLSLAVFLAAICAGAIIFIIPKRFRFLWTIFFVLSSIIFNKDYWRANGFFYQNDSVYLQPYPGTTDTGECSPLWSVRFMEDFPKSAAELINGEATIKEINRSTTEQVFTVEAKTSSRLAINTLYFPGWQILVNSQPVTVEFQDPAWRGIMTFNLPVGEHQIKTVFKETKLRLAADFVSGLGLIILLFGGIISERRWKNRKFR